MKIIPQRFKLSSQEFQVYSLYAAGHSRSFIADSLQITSAQVRYSARCVRDRLSLPSTSHALFYLAFFRYVNIDCKLVLSLVPFAFYKWVGLVLFYRSSPPPKTNRFLQILCALMTSRKQ